MVTSIFKSVQSRILPESFYTGSEVKEIARRLLGKHLCTSINGKFTSGMITETEAYEGTIDRASHAYGGRRTDRTEVMFAKGGVSYVYLCYGIHHLFNVVTGPEDQPHAVLIRAIEPADGIGSILKRRGTSILHKNIASGPGTLTQALGIRTSHSGISLRGDVIWIEDRNVKISPGNIVVSPRIGVDYAGPHAKWPNRFRIIN